MKHSPTAYLTRAQASAYLGEKHDLACRPCTLAKYATIGGGPPYVMKGKWSVYQISDLDDWARTRTRAPVSRAMRAEADKVIERAA